MQSRRDVLRMGAGVATVGGITSLAGCSNVPVVGSYFEDEVDYTEWAYDPAELEQRSLWVAYQDVGSILETDEVPDKGELRDNVTSDYSGALLADDVEIALSVGQSEILSGSFDGGDIVDEMEFGSADNYGDFDVYTDSSGDEERDALVATDGDHLVRTTPAPYGEVEVRDELELLLDTYAEDADRYIDINGNFEQVDGELESGDIAFVNANTESSAEDASDDTTVAMGLVASVDGAEMNGTFASLYKAESGVDVDEAETQVTEIMGEETDVTDVSQDGRMVTAEYTVPTEEF